MRNLSIILLALALLWATAASGATSVTQWGITWTFAHDYTTGQFANGDYYVVADTTYGPDPNVRLISIDPPPTVISQDGENWNVDGSMINPDPVQIDGGWYAYDDRGGPYDGGLLVEAPATLTAGDSLVSSISWRIGEVGCPSRYSSDPGSALYHMPRPPLKVAAVLTVLASAPPANSLRPPYVAGDKPIYNKSSIQFDLLPNLASVSGGATYADLLAQCDHMWLDHVTREQGEWHNPTQNMPSYGRDQMSRLNKIILALCADDLTAGQKEVIATNMVQIGLDLYHIVVSGGGWGNAGGAMRIGRKWPILFAGVMLDNADMMAIGDTYAKNSLRFQEDSQVFTITQAEVDLHPPTTRTNCSISHVTYEGKTVAVITDDNGGSWWNNDAGGTQPIQSGRGFPSDFWVRVHRGGDTYDILRASSIHDSDNSKIRVNQAALSYYGLVATGSGLTVEIQLFPAYKIGESDWAENHDNWRYYQMFYSRGYRVVSCKSWSGAMLAALMMKVDHLWGHNLFFDQTDYYMAEQVGSNDTRTNDIWTMNMWDAYRDNYVLGSGGDGENGGNGGEPPPAEPSTGQWLLFLR
jgi:hypothetical protein